MSAPVAYQVILEPGIGQFREFESPGVHTIKATVGGTPNFHSRVKAKEYSTKVYQVPFLGFFIPFLGSDSGVKIGGTPLP